MKKHQKELKNARSYSCRVYTPLSVDIDTLVRAEQQLKEEEERELDEDAEGVAGETRKFLGSSIHLDYRGNGQNNFQQGQDDILEDGPAE